MFFYVSATAMPETGQRPPGGQIRAASILRCGWIIFPKISARLVSAALADYFPRHLNRDLFVYLAEAGERVAAATFLRIMERPANPHFITGKIGIFMNVLSYPECRRKGDAAQIVKRLIEIGQTHDLSYIELSATESGRPLYEKLGFTESVSGYTAMRLFLQ